ncbi:hypothetical protein GHT06_019655 [Daphnia sinensis]|uniref:tRNA modification GTPase GTPBP3, mitochondrial n=1 Tax=Daphnia sinensis TaxID=1820382 RepID=A0AAD5PQS1_9CRUS|nr:hypothetical protein GHT06_019655 [Daphnia sinensis]
MLNIVKSNRFFCNSSLVLYLPCLRRYSSTRRSTIFALSSGTSRSAISVIRISGPNSVDVISKMTKLNKERIIPRKALLRKIVDPNNGELLDNGLVLWFPQPHSFTGEDSVELHVHGGIAVVSSIINALQKLPGFRIAEAGEFTKRAYLAGKLDATEVEGLADLLRAETETQRRQAIRQATGELAVLYNEWRTSILTCMAHLEAYVDFGEDQDIGHEVLSSLQHSIQSLKSEVGSHLNDNRRGERLRNGVRVAIIGEPNVGKSSLINILSRRNVAIVSPYAGTTRDILEISLDIGGYPIVLCDTAGLRHSVDPVENEGLRRAREAASTADLVIIVMDASTGPLQLSTKEMARLECERLNLSFSKSHTELCANPMQEAPLITSSRQRHHVQVAFKHLEKFLDIIEQQGDLALAGEQLRRSAKQIGSITARGKIDTEEMLDVLFRSFCIGKKSYKNVMNYKSHSSEIKRREKSEKEWR